jgi:peptide/nickel transport system permease protein
MSVDSASAASGGVGAVREARLVRFARRYPLGMVGALIVGILVLTAVFAPWLAPYSPYEINAAAILLPPDAAHWFGTDEYGRDVLSRIIWGARISVFVAFSAVILGTSVGALLGLVGGYVGGPVDYVIQRVMDTMLAFPMLILGLALVAALGSGIGNVVIALAVVIVPTNARVIRSITLAIREMPFVEAARNLGFSTPRIIFRHVLPNCIAPFIVVAASALGYAILSEAALSFLGLGTPPPEPSWGVMLSGTTQTYMKQAPWLAIFPGLAITLAIFGFNFIGDALRDAIDPRLRGR